MAVPAEALSKAGAAAVAAAIDRTAAARGAQATLEQKRSGLVGHIRRVRPAYREPALTAARDEVSAAAAREALVREVVDGGYRYTYGPDVRRRGEDRALHYIENWEIQGTRGDGEAEVLSRENRLGSHGRGGYGGDYTYGVYSGSHGETRYTADEAERRGKTVHGILYPIYQVATQESR